MSNTETPNVRQRIADVLWAHRWYLNRDNPPFGRCACDWPPTEARLEINAREHPTHVADVLVRELDRMAFALDELS